MDLEMITFYGCVCVLSCVRFFATPWTLCNPARLLCPWDFPRQESWSGLPGPPPGDLPGPGIEPPRVLVILRVASEAVS